ncbi:hypothetical protein ACFX2I_032785 [Malus domestica]
MQSMLLNHFLPRNYEHVLVEKYHGCVQGTCSIQEYSQEFFNLAATNQLTEFLTQQTARYLYGLKANIRDCISLQRMTTPAEVEELTVSIELLEKKKKSNQFAGYRKNCFEHATVVNKGHKTITLVEEQPEMVEGGVIEEDYKEEGDELALVL